MGQSGNTIFLGLDLLALLLLLLAAGAALIRKPFSRLPRAFLMAWLLILLLIHGARLLPALTSVSVIPPDPLWLRFLTFLAATLFFQSLLPQRIAVFFSYLLVAYLSVYGTLFFTGQAPQRLINFSYWGQGLLASLILATLIHLAGKKSLYILQQPLFWLSAGSLFVLLMEAALAMLNGSGFSPMLAAEDREVLLRFFTILQYVFFAAGLWIRDHTPEEELRNS